MNNQAMDLKPSLVDRAKASDAARQNAFHERVIELSKTFAIKEAARLLRVSTGFLRAHAKKHQVEFADRDSRTRDDKRNVKKLWDHYTIHFDLPKTIGEHRPVQPNELKLTPGQEAEGRKALWNRQIQFYEKARKIAETSTLGEASKLLGVSFRFLKNFAYMWEVTFVGMPSFDVRNAFFERTAALAAIARNGVDAARELNVTPRFLLRYSKNWLLEFPGLEEFVADYSLGRSSDTDDFMDDDSFEEFEGQVEAAAEASPEAQAQPEVKTKQVSKAPRQPVQRQKKASPTRRRQAIQPSLRPVEMARKAWSGRPHLVATSGAIVAPAAQKCHPLELTSSVNQPAPSHLVPQARTSTLGQRPETVGPGLEMNREGRRRRRTQMQSTGGAWQVGPSSSLSPPPQPWSLGGKKYRSEGAGPLTGIAGGGDRQADMLSVRLIEIRPGAPPGRTAAFCPPAMGAARLRYQAFNTPYPAPSPAWPLPAKTAIADELAGPSHMSVGR